jgi:hypothetical protein
MRVLEGGLGMFGFVRGDVAAALSTLETCRRMTIPIRGSLAVLPGMVCSNLTLTRGICLVERRIGSRLSSAGCKTV